MKMNSLVIMVNSLEKFTISPARKENIELKKERKGLLEKRKYTQEKEEKNVEKKQERK